MRPVRAPSGEPVLCVESASVVGRELESGTVEAEGETEPSPNSLEARGNIAPHMRQKRASVLETNPQLGQVFVIVSPNKCRR